MDGDMKKYRKSLLYVSIFVVVLLWFRALPPESLHYIIDFLIGMTVFSAIIYTGIVIYGKITHTSYEK